MGESGYHESKETGPRDRLRPKNCLRSHLGSEDNRVYSPHPFPGRGRSAPIQFIRQSLRMRTLSGMHVLALACCVALSPGCASLKTPSWFAKKEKPSDGPKVITPRDKMVQLRELSKNGDKLTPELRERVSSELANGIAHEQDPILRAQVLRTLGRFPSEKSLVVCTAGLHDHQRDVRIAACESLGRLGGAEATANLSRTLAEDADVDVRLAAARALGETADAKGVAALGEALQDQDPAMQHRAMASMKKISGQDFGTDVDAWREYAKTGQGPPTPTFAERFRNLFR